jgi:hypothetical protein
LVVNNLVFVLRAALLDRKVFEELSEDGGSMGVAGAIVVLAAVSAAIAGWSITPVNAQNEGLPSYLSGLDAKTLAVLLSASAIPVSWVLWSGINFYVGTMLLRGKASYRLTLRAVGVAYSPALLYFLAAIPNFTIPIYQLIPLWVLATVTVAIKATQGYNWLKVILPALIGWFIAWTFIQYGIVIPYTLGLLLRAE